MQSRILFDLIILAWTFTPADVAFVADAVVVAATAANVVAACVSGCAHFSVLAYNINHQLQGFDLFVLIGTNPRSADPSIHQLIHFAEKKLVVAENEYLSRMP